MDFTLFFVGRPLEGLKLPLRKHFWGHARWKNFYCFDANCLGNFNALLCNTLGHARYRYVWGRSTLKCFIFFYSTGVFTAWEPQFTRKISNAKILDSWKGDYKLILVFRFLWIHAEKWPQHIFVISILKHCEKLPKFWQRLRDYPNWFSVHRILLFQGLKIWIRLKTKFIITDRYIWMMEEYPTVLFQKW